MVLDARTSCQFSHRRQEYRLMVSSWRATERSHMSQALLARVVTLLTVSVLYSIAMCRKMLLKALFLNEDTGLSLP